MSKGFYGGVGVFYAILFLACILFTVACSILVFADTYTVDYSNTVNTVPDNYFCVHSLGNEFSVTGSYDFDGNGAAEHDEYINYTFHRAKADEAGVQCFRIDMDKANLCDTNEDCTNNRSGVSPHTTYVGFASEVQWAYDTNRTVLFVAEDNPLWNSNMSYKCASQNRSCGPADYALDQTTNENFWEQTLCATLGVCDLEAYNEGYNSYWQRDVPRTSAYCENLTRDHTTMVLNTMNRWRAGPYYNTSNHILIAALYPDEPGGKAFTINSCSAAFSAGVLGNVTNATGTRASSHPYSFNSNGNQGDLPDWELHFENDVAWARSRGYYELVASEFARYTVTPMGNGSTPQNYTQAYRDYMLLYAVTMPMPEVKQLYQFPWSTNANNIGPSTEPPTVKSYFCMENQLGQGAHLDGSCTAVFYAMKNATTYFPSESDIVNVTSTVNGKMLASYHPNGSAYVMLISKNTTATSTATITLNNFNATPYSLIDMSNGTVHVLSTANNSTTNLATLLQSEVRIYEVNFTQEQGSSWDCQSPMLAAGSHIFSFNGGFVFQQNTSCSFTGTSTRTYTTCGSDSRVKCQ